LKALRTVPGLTASLFVTAAGDIPDSYRRAALAKPDSPRIWYRVGTSRRPRRFETVLRFKPKASVKA
jgi:hypothetical protein